MNRAKKIFDKGSNSLVLVNDKGALTSNSSGVKQLLEWEWEIRGAEIADKIVGYAAACIFSHFGARTVYAEIISQAAMDRLEEDGINFEFAKRVPFIQNRDSTGICPMEEVTLGFPAEEAVERLREALRDRRHR